MYDVITIGSATRDVFVRSKELKAIESPQFKTGEAACFNLGSKVDIDELHIFAGGSALNSAITFANQGYACAIVAAIGEDPGGKEVRSTLKDSGVETKFIQTIRDAMSAYSIILSGFGGERTIMVYRGASERISMKSVPWDKLQAKWLYVTHLSGENAVLLDPLIKHAKRHGMYVAMNPGKTQLRLGKGLAPVLDAVDTLIINREEASYLTGVSYEDETRIFQTLDQWVKGIVVMTEGPKGVVVSDGNYVWKAGILKTAAIVDRTGAGDAFGSGFICGLLERPDDVEYAMEFASANATGVLAEWGATNGVLKKGESIYEYGRLKITKSKIE